MAGLDAIATLADIPRVHAGDSPGRAALVCEGRTTSWRDLDARSSRVAQGLRAAGVGPGARVAILDKDSDRLWHAVFGCAKAGAAVLGINWRLTTSEIEYLLSDSGAEALFLGQEFAARVEPLLSRLPGIRLVVALSGRHAAWPEFESWRDAQADADPALDGGPESLAALMYTSGTTGHPKGVMLAHRSFFAVARALRAAGDPWIGWSERDVFLSGFPSFHVGGLWWAMTGLSHGGTMVVQDAFAGWKCLDLIARHRVTKVCMAPAMVALCLSEPECPRTDFSALGHLVYGGSPIPVPVLERGLATFRCGFAQIYGLTETGNTAVCLRPEDHVAGVPELLRAAGRPYPGVRVRTIDPAGRVLAPREVGEICIDSPANMLGYWRKPEATAQTLVDGWVRTGDAGFLDERGYVHVCDRVKDMIIYAGENVYPAEIESVLAGHPAVAECAVIGVPDDRWGELVKAVVVLKPGAAATPVELIAHCRRSLADFKVPKSVEFAASLPRTSSGKLRKAELREPFWRGRDRRI